MKDAAVPDLPSACILPPSCRWEGGQEPAHVVWRNPACVGGVQHRRHHRAFIHKAADAALRRGECERALKGRQRVTVRPCAHCPSARTIRISSTLP